MADKKTFEQCMAELDGVVRRLEAGNITLDESLLAFESGIKLTRECEQLLTEAKGKVEKLVRSVNGDVRMEPFEPKE